MPRKRSKPREKAPPERPHLQAVMVGPGTSCSNCWLPLAWQGWQRPGKNELLCEGCARFLSSAKEPSP
jgi:hypothetical protein